MKIIDVDIEELIPYENNPRVNDSAVEPVMNSIREFGFKVPVVIDKNNVIVCGHTRYKASIRLGLKKIPCLIADDLTDEQIKAFRLADNKTSEFAFWDNNLLDLEIQNILNIDLNDFGFELETVEEEKNNDEKKFEPYGSENSEKLSEKFIVPPFNVFDTRQGYWQDRKIKWLEYFGDTTETRNSKEQMAYTFNPGTLKGTSQFDPVLCEVVLHWFCPKGGFVLDPFAGSCVRGLVSKMTGREYLGTDIRNEQIVENERVAKKIGIKTNWVCDDGINVSKYLDDFNSGEKADFLLTCPPYFDIEHYSDDPKDISNMEYEDFIEQYKNIISNSLQSVKENRFACIVIGDVRNKKTGTYYGLVDETSKIMKENGFDIYNNIILLNVYGSGAMRANRQMVNRKPVNTFQNVLIGYKGNANKIQEHFPPIEEKYFCKYIDK